MSDDQPPATPADSTGGDDSVAPIREPRSADPVLVRLREITDGEYNVEKELGRGGMATVYLAHDIALDRKVAIKVMSSDLFNAGDVLVDRFLREARTGARLNHPHIIPVYAIRQARDLIFFVMKFIDGKPLDDVIRGSGPLPIPLVSRVMAQAADALGYAHRNGIVHRDVKPGNLMLDKEGWVVLTDLGIAKVQEVSSLTATGSAIGTPTYMSPEQSSGSKATTGASDQYSLGCVAFEMLSGRPPFQGDSVVALIFQHHAEPPPPLHQLRPDCPPEIVSAISRMLAKAPEDRFGSMEEVAQIFREASSGDEEEFRLLLRAFATGGDSGDVVKRINTPRTPAARPSQAAQVRTPSRPSAREVSVNTTSMTPVPRASTPALGGAPVPPITNPGAGAPTSAQNWPRTLLRPPEQARVTARSFRMPGILTLMVVGFFGWYFLTPGLGDLESTTPQLTALMQLRQEEAEAAVRRGQAPGAEGSCEGIRNDLPTCRKQLPVPLGDIAEPMREATVLAVDTLFNARQSADWSMMRMTAGYPRAAFEFGNSVDRSDLFAVIPQVPNKMDVIGRSGSLTQRLAQVLFYPPDDGLFRKAREITVSNRIAKKLTKDRILELYLNTAEFGPGLYGVEAAAQAYFNVSAKALNRAQAATLAATLATPRTSNPRTEPAAMRRRQALILRRLNGEAVAIPSDIASGDSASRAP